MIPYVASLYSLPSWQVHLVRGMHNCVELNGRFMCTFQALNNDSYSQLWDKSQDEQGLSSRLLTVTGQQSRLGIEPRPLTFEASTSLMSPEGSPCCHCQYRQHLPVHALPLPCHTINRIYQHFIKIYQDPISCHPQPHNTFLSLIHFRMSAPGPPLHLP